MAVVAQTTQVEVASSSETWLARKRADAGWFLFALAGLTLWTVGFIDLVGRVMRPATVLNRYTTWYAALIVVYALGIVPWAMLVARGDGAVMLKRAIDYAQRRTWVGVACMALAFLVFVSLAVMDPWLNLPTLSVVTFTLALMFVGAILFGRPTATSRMRTWQKVTLAVLAIWFVVELTLQVAAFASALPFENRAGQFMAYGRIYQVGEGRTNTLANRNGWHFTDNATASSAKKILLLGDSFIEGLQVAPSQNIGALLDASMSASGARVVSLGFPGFGAALWADPKLIPFTSLQYAPKEVVAFVHLADDTQMRDAADGVAPFFFLNDADEPVTADSEAKLRHDLQHLIIRGYDPVNPVLALLSNLFSVQIARRFFDPKYFYETYGDRGSPRAPTRSSERATPTEPFGPATPLFEKSPSADHKANADRAMALLQAQLKTLKTDLAALGISMRVVTVPFFPREFFDSAGASWRSDFGEYDLLLPEKQLVQFARDNAIPILPMGEYLHNKALTPAQIKSLYFRDGAGRWTPQGHAFFAEAVYDCFYTASRAAECPTQ